MNDNKKAEIKALVESRWASSPSKVQLAKQIEKDYIFGEVANNEHYKIDEIMEVVKEVDLEKNPPVEE